MIHSCCPLNAEINNDRANEVVTDVHPQADQRRTIIDGRASGSACEIAPRSLPSSTLSACQPYASKQRQTSSENASRVLPLMRKAVDESAAKGSFLLVDDLGVAYRRMIMRAPDATPTIVLI